MTPDIVGDVARSLTGRTGIAINATMRPVSDLSLIHI